MQWFDTFVIIIVPILAIGIGSLSGWRAGRRRSAARADANRALVSAPSGNSSQYVTNTDMRGSSRRGVVLYLPPPATEEDAKLDLLTVEDALIEAIEAASAGEFDGNGIDLETGWSELYMYGSDPDELVRAITPAVRDQLSLPPVTYLVKQYSDSPEDDVRVLVSDL